MERFNERNMDFDAVVDALGTNRLVFWDLASETEKYPGMVSGGQQDEPVQIAIESEQPDDLDSDGPAECHYVLRLVRQIDEGLQNSRIVVWDVERDAERQAASVGLKDHMIQITLAA